MVTDRMQEPCTTASCLQGHVFWAFDDDDNTCG